MGKNKQIIMGVLLLILTVVMLFSAIGKIGYLGINDSYRVPVQVKITQTATQTDAEEIEVNQDEDIPLQGAFSDGSSVVVEKTGTYGNATWTQYSKYGNGSNLTTYTGITRLKILDTLENNHSKYLSIPYNYGYSSNNSGMNCEGFVDMVLRDAGYTKTISKGGGGDGWITTLRENNISYRTYYSDDFNSLADAVVNDGYAQPGDIIYMWDGGKNDALYNDINYVGLPSAISAYHHVGFFVGNYFSMFDWAGKKRGAYYRNGLWHSIGTSDNPDASRENPVIISGLSGNMLSCIIPKSNNTKYATVIKFASQNGESKLLKKAVISSTTYSERDVVDYGFKSVKGAEYVMFTIDEFPISYSYWDKSTPTLENYLANVFSDPSGQYNNYDDIKNKAGKLTYEQFATVDKVDSSGEAYAEFKNVPPGVYFITETKAAEGYELDNKVYAVRVKPQSSIKDNTASVLISKEPEQEKPMLNIDVLLEKVDSDNNQRKLSNAEFQINYYKEKYDSDPSKQGINPDKVWKVKTDEKGQARANDNYKISGDEWFTDNDGNIAFPEGTLTIKETKAPKGYIMGDEVYVRKLEIKNDTSNQTVGIYNAPVIPNTSVKAYLSIIKKDSVSKKEIISDSATFKVWSYKNNAYVSFSMPANSNTKISEFATENGKILLPGTLELGRYRLDEIKAPYGYVKNDQGVEFELTENTNYKTYQDESGKALDYGVYEIEVFNPPIYGELQIKKVCEESVEESGAYKVVKTPLSNIRFDIYAAEKIKQPYGNDTAFIENQLVESIITDENGIAKTSKNLPEGKYYIREVDDSGEYYSIDDIGFAISYTSPNIITRQNNGNTETVDVEVKEIVNHRKINLKTTATDSKSGLHEGAADGEVNVIDEVSISNLIIGTDYEIKGVMMDKQTGECVQEDGEIVAAELKFTAEQGNETKKLEFKVKNSEMLLGKQIVIFEKLYSGDVELASHEDINDIDQTVIYSGIKTELTDKRNGKHVSFADNIELVDIVSYEGLIPEQKYTLKGILYNKTTKQPIERGGKVISTTKEFIPKQSSGTETVEFSIDASIMAGNTIVACEYLYVEDVEVAKHEDLEDAKQSVDIPSIVTIATNETGEKEIPIGEKAVVIDRIEYTNLTPGYEYNATGSLIRKADGQPLMQNGKCVTGTVTFTPEERNGYVEVKFELDTSELEGEELVVYETIFVNSIVENEDSASLFDIVAENENALTSYEIVAEHQSIDDAGQTVKVKEKPQETTTETKTVVKGTSVTYNNTPKTGDNVPIIPIVLIGVSSAIAMGMLIYFKCYKNKRKSTKS